MKDTKPKPRASTKVPLREPAKPLEQPAARPLPPDHPIHGLLAPAKAAEHTLIPDYSSTRVQDPTQVEPVQPISERSGTRVPEYQTTLVPESRYYKKPNAAADALDRHLTGAESKVYEHLWRLTVGFNRDRCQVRVSTLCERTGYRSMKTVRIALFGLESKGLIMKVSRNNDPLGDEYVMLDSGTRVPKYQSTQAKSALVLESKNTQELNTVVKEQNTDDEAAPLARALAQAERELSGKVTADSSKWEDLASVLVTELKIAAGRTTVSSVPAFLAEHLRRRLWKVAKGGEGGATEAPEPRSPGAKAAPEPAPADCPDCFGTGMFYPEGFDKGVARCRHEKLTKADGRAGDE